MQRSIPTYPQLFQEKSLSRLIKSILSAREAPNLFKSLGAEYKNITLQTMRRMVGGV